ncbi:MAG: efflux transporter periplasmic adaptor subunit [unclassified Hahellaceae]|nr:efflux transporter periplasmic adaptor subunit [Hahellaceae bacterium]|tara:strand:+ start:6150 stop:7460 length:1311 start_codon:yes stop_codon:yes gene_type:complete
MNKTLLAFLFTALASASQAQTSDSPGHAHEDESPAAPHGEEEGSHDNHKEEDHDEHGAHDEHKPASEHGHDEHSDKDHAEKGHEDHGDESHEEGEEGHDEGASASLAPSQMKLAGIQVKALTAQPVDYTLYAPGEILSNGYSSYRVSPRVASVVLRRHVALGAHVKKGQQLVTLFSESVAQAQADYRRARPEWQRVQELGRRTVGEQRYISAKADLEAAEATLLAYGLNADDLKSLSSQQTKALGEYTLRAEIDGSVLADNFEQGQRIEAGAPLVTLADEKQLWVEAHLPADRSLALPEGTPAEVVTGDVRVPAVVSQEAHTIDPVTRTRTIRLLVENKSHRLHPGQFAEVFFRFTTDKPVLAVPEGALMRGADGDWTVFVEDHPGEFLPIEVELGRALGLLREITGIEPGARVVTEGAFFVASQIAKGGFDPHNH